MNIFNNILENNDVLLGIQQEENIKELSSLFNNAKSFSNIDKTSFINLKDKPLQYQLYIVSHFIKDNIFFYSNLINKYNLISNYIHIDPRKIYSKYNLDLPIKKLIKGNAYYDLKIKGDSIKNVELQIISNEIYNIPFIKNNDEWVLLTFTKQSPFLIFNIPWVKFFIKIYTKKTNSTVSFYYSTFIINSCLLKKISSMENLTFNINDSKFKNIVYDGGYIFLK